MRRYLIIFIIIAVCLGIISSFFILNNSSKKLTAQDKEKALAKILGRKVNLNQKEAPKGNVSFSGKYISFLYPAAAKIYIPTLNGKPVDQGELEGLIFDISEPKMAVFVNVASSSAVHGINDIPGVRLRQTQSGAYEQKEVLANGQKGLVFDSQSNTGFEKTVFFYTNGLIFSFSLQGVDRESINDLFSKIMATVKFVSS